MKKWIIFPIALTGDAWAGLLYTMFIKNVGENDFPTSSKVGFSKVLNVL